MAEKKRRPVKADAPNQTPNPGSGKDADLQPRGNQAANDTAAAEKESPTQEELDGMLGEAKTDGLAKADEGKPSGGDDGGGGGGESITGQEKGQEAAGGGTPVAMATPASAMPTGDPGIPWDEVKKAFPWDEELALLNQFVTPELTSQPTGTEPETIAGVHQPPDRGQLVQDALGKGALTGLVEGGKGIVIDSLINAASSKIPMVAGFVEMGKLAYDPGAYFSDMGNNLLGGGKFGAAFEKLTSGDPVEMLASIVDLADGVATVIGTLSSICWLVAGIGFVLSWIPGMQWLIPFVATAASWGTTLGMIGTMIQAWNFFLKLGLMGLRTLDIMFWAKDDDLLDKATELQEQTASAVQTFTERAGDNARGQMQDRVNAKRGGANQRANNGTADMSPMQRVKAITADGFLGKKSDGSSDLWFNKKQWNQSWEATKIVNKDSNVLSNPLRTDQDVLMKRTEGMKSLGMDVQSAGRQSDYDKNAKAAKEKYEAARTKTNEAQHASEAATQRHQDAVGDYNASKQALDTKRPQLEEGIKLQETSVANAQKIEAEAKATLQSKKNANDLAFKEAAEAAEYHNDPRVTNERTTETSDGVKNAEKALIDAKTQRQTEEGNLSNLRDDLSQQRKQLAETDAKRKQAALEETEANAAHEAAKLSEGAKGANAKAATKNADDLRTHNAEYKEAGRMSWRRDQLDLQGSGPNESDLYGQNRGVGRTGSLTGWVTGADFFKEATSSFYETVGFSQDDASTMAGADSETDKDTTATEAAPAEQESSPSTAPVEIDTSEVGGDLDQLNDRILAPPLQVPDQVDGTQMAYVALQGEEQETRDNAARLESVIGVGEAQLPELDAADAFVETQKTDIGTYHTGLDELQERNDALSKQATESGSQVGEATSKGSPILSKIASFADPFISLMGRIPSQFVGNASAGTSGAKEMKGLATDTPENLSTSGKTTGEAGAEADVRTKENAQASAAGDIALGTVGTLGQSVATELANTTTGLSELATAKADNDAHLASIEAEKTRLSGEYGSGVTEGASWAFERQTIRLQDLAILEGKMTTVEQHLAQ